MTVHGRVSAQGVECVSGGEKMLAMWWLPALIALVLLAELLSGKALNPLKGMRPGLVGRSTRPGQYWTAIVMQSAFLALALWIARGAP